MSPTWWSLAYIARLILGDDRYGDDPAGGQRTAGRWMADLGRAGWVERQHRFVAEGGQVRGTSNLWRFTIPAPLRQAALPVEDAARGNRAVSAKGRARAGPTPKAPQHRHSGPQEPARTVPSYRDQDLRRSSSCPACEGRRFVELPDGWMTACGACGAKGPTQVTHPPLKPVWPLQAPVKTSGCRPPSLGQHTTRNNHHQRPRWRPPGVRSRPSNEGHIRYGRPYLTVEYSATPGREPNLLRR
ncbi:MAG: hypothetical protein M3Y91_04820 [Actinomycetota bacterium]|nr:hypothetical protein [Actinomycetota bacterium]